MTTPVFRVCRLMSLALTAALLCACTSQRPMTGHPVAVSDSTQATQASDAQAADGSAFSVNDGADKATAFLPHFPLPPKANQACDAARRARPVVLLHGTFSNARRSFAMLAPLLHDAGWCVFALNYGKSASLQRVFATGDMDASADEILAFIRQVLDFTQAAQLDVVGHSQGGTLALFQGKFNAQPARIRQIVAISPSVRGTQTAQALSSDFMCVACTQQSPQSAFIRRLHQGGVNPGGIRTLILSTDNDLVVLPVQSQFVFEPGVENVRLQQLFPGRVATHSGILRDADAMAWVVKWMGQQGGPVAR